MNLKESNERCILLYRHNANTTLSVIQYLLEKHDVQTELLTADQVS